jgi:Enolase C-terminal domain-like
LALSTDPVGDDRLLDRLRECLERKRFVLLIRHQAGGIGNTRRLEGRPSAVRSLPARTHEAPSQRVPIATGENTQMISAGGVTFPEPDVTNCGGITVFMKVAHLAEAFNLPLTSHGAHDLTVHLLAAVPNRSYLEVHGFGLDRYIEQPIAIVEGNVLAPDRPRHGRGVRLGGVGESAGSALAAIDQTRPVDAPTDARGRGFAVGFSKPI